MVNSVKIAVNATLKAWTQFDVGQLTIKIRVNEKTLKLICKATTLRFINLN